MERLNDLCREEYKKIIDKEDVAKIIENNTDLSLESFISKDFDFHENVHFLFEINK